jgi:hypothetical protein
VLTGAPQSQLKSMVGESANDVHALALAERDENHHSPLFISLLSKVLLLCCAVILQSNQQKCEAWFA